MSEADDMKKLGQLLKQAREKSGLTQDEVTRDVLNAHSGTLSRLERGKNLPAISALRFLIEAYGLSGSKAQKLYDLHRAVMQSRSRAKVAEQLRRHKQR